MADQRTKTPMSSNPLGMLEALACSVSGSTARFDAELRHLTRPPDEGIPSDATVRVAIPVTVPMSVDVKTNVHTSMAHQYSRESNIQPSSVVSTGVCVSDSFKPGPSTCAAVQQHEPGAANRKPFEVDTGLIASVPTSSQAEELKELGLTVYNQDEFEQGVMAQVDEALEVQEKERLDKILKKELKSVEDDMRSVNQEIGYMNKVLGQLKPQQAQTKEIARRLTSIKTQRENKLRQMKTLKAKRKCITAKLNGETTEDNQVFEDGSGAASLEDVLGLGVGQSETERERMIRLGEMTPFGTAVAEAKNAAAPEMTSFEKYLLNQQEMLTSNKTRKSQGKTKSKTILKSSSISKDTGKKAKDKQSKHEKSEKKLKKSASTSVIQYDRQDSSSSQDSGPSHSHKRDNFFDANDKREYRPAERDFSQMKHSRKRKIRYPKLKHNFSEDRALSDVEIGDEDDDYYDDDAEYIPDEEYPEEYDDEYPPSPKKTRGRPRGKMKKSASDGDEQRIEWTDDEDADELFGPRRKKKKVPTATLR